MTENTSPLKISSVKKYKPRFLVYIIGLIFGIIIGLLYAWLIDPAVYPYSLPSDLHPADKAVYRSLVAQVYAATGNLTRAEMRLAVLDEDDTINTVSSQAQRALAEGHTEEAYALALLATNLFRPDEPVEMPFDTMIPTETLIPEVEQLPTQTLPIPTMTP